MMCQPAARLFLSTLSLRRATCCSLRYSASCWHFYPRSPCGERLKIRFLFRLPKKFLSTLSLRRATTCIRDTALLSIHFYPRSPCGERRVAVLGIQHRVGISIHALLAESDVLALCFCGGVFDFYPRSPCGERLGRAFWPGLSL